MLGTVSVSYINISAYTFLIVRSFFLPIGSIYKPPCTTSSAGDGDLKNAS